MHLVSADVAREKAQAKVDGAVKAADGDACDEALSQWTSARHHLRDTDSWQLLAHHTLDPAIARCFARRAATSTGDDQVQAIAEARTWDGDDALVVRTGRTIADALEATGDAALTAGDSKAAYAAYRDVLRADPTRAKVRRRAEEARDASLGLSDTPDDQGDDATGGGE